MAWKIKMNGNDELRQKFVDLDGAAGGIPRLDSADETLRGTRKRAATTLPDPDWGEFFDVIKGNGPATVNGWKPGGRRGTRALGCAMDAGPCGKEGRRAAKRRRE